MQTNAVSWCQTLVIRQIGQSSVSHKWHKQSVHNYYFSTRGSKLSVCQPCCLELYQHDSGLTHFPPIKGYGHSLLLRDWCLLQEECYAFVLKSTQRFADRNRKSCAGVFLGVFCPKLAERQAQLLMAVRIPRQSSNFLMMRQFSLRWNSLLLKSVWKVLLCQYSCVLMCALVGFWDCFVSK